MYLTTASLGVIGFFRGVDAFFTWMSDTAKFTVDWVYQLSPGESGVFLATMSLVAYAVVALFVFGLYMWLTHLIYKLVPKLEKVLVTSVMVLIVLEVVWFFMGLGNVVQLYKLVFPSLQQLDPNS